MGPRTNSDIPRIPARRPPRPAATLTPDSRIPPPVHSHPPTRPGPSYLTSLLYFPSRCFPAGAAPLPAALAAPPRQALLRGGRRDGCQARPGESAVPCRRAARSPLVHPPRRGDGGCWSPLSSPGTGVLRAPRLRVPGGPRPRRFVSAEQRCNYTSGYKLTLCATESCRRSVMCSVPDGCSL